MYRVYLTRHGSRGRYLHDKGQALKHQFVQQRTQSTSASKTPAAVKYIGGSLAGLGAISVATIAYAGFDKQFKEKLSQQHSYVKSTLDFFYGASSSKGKDGNSFSQSHNDVVVVTTMDHQPGISAVDVDISNMDEKRKRAKKRGGKDEAGSSGGGGGAGGIGEESKLSQEASEVSEEELSDTAKSSSLADTSLESSAENAATEGGAAESAVVAASDAVAGEAILEVKDTTETDVEATEVHLHVAEGSTEAPSPDVAVTEATEDPVALSEQPSEQISQQGVAFAKGDVKSDEDAIKQAEAELDSIAMEKASIETILQVHLDKLLTESQDVINAQKRAAGTIYTYVNHLGHALSVPADDPTFNETWKNTASLESDSQAAIDQAKSSESELQSKIDAIRGMVGAIRKYGPSEIADKAQEVSTNISLKVQRTSEDVRKASNDLLSMVEYHALAAKAKQEFEKGLGELSAEVKSSEENAASSDKSVNPLLVYAFKKVEYLVNALDKRTEQEEHRVLTALEKQREEEEKRFNDLLLEEIKRVKKEDADSYQKKEMELITRYEADMRQQLKRQASAHREHLSDVLNLQAKELEESHNRVLENRLSEQHKIYEDDLEQKVAFLKGVDDGVTMVVDVEEKNRQLRELWLAVQGLFAAFQEPLLNGSSRALMPEIVALKCRAGDNQVVQDALSTIPSSAAKNGVVTEAELSRRFRKVKNISRHVAQVEEGGSLISYLASYLRSLFILDIARAKAVDEPIDPENIDTYEILSKAEACVKSGDLEQAVKFMNLLQGVSRHVAQDWLDEAKVHLETRLALDFLLAYARSMGAGTTQ